MLDYYTITTVPSRLPHRCLTLACLTPLIVVKLRISFVTATELLLYPSLWLFWLVVLIAFIVLLIADIWIFWLLLRWRIDRNFNWPVPLYISVPANSALPLICGWINATAESTLLRTLLIWATVVICGLAYSALLITLCDRAEKDKSTLSSYHLSSESTERPPHA